MIAGCAEICTLTGKKKKKLISDAQQEQLEERSTVRRGQGTRLSMASASLGVSEKDGRGETTQSPRSKRCQETSRQGGVNLPSHTVWVHTSPILLSVSCFHPALRQRSGKFCLPRDRPHFCCSGKMGKGNYRNLSNPLVLGQLQCGYSTAPGGTHSICPPLSQLVLLLYHHDAAVPKEQAVHRGAERGRGWGQAEAQREKQR